MQWPGVRSNYRRGIPVIAVATLAAGTVLSPPTTTPGPAITAVRATAAALPLGPSLLDSDEAWLPDLPAAAASFGEALIGVYLTLEPYAQYGAELLQWALRWLPWVGILAPQVGFFYDFGESIIRSVVFNTAYVIDGDIGFGEALNNVASATATAFNNLVDAQIYWLENLLPPLPPLPTLAAVAVSPPDGPAPDLSALTDFGGSDASTLTELVTDPGGALLSLLP